MIKNGQEANETNFNAAFVSRTVDTSTTGKLALQNTADANSGGTIANAQRAITETFDAVGITGEGDATRKQYSSTNYVAAGDSHKTAIGKLDARAFAQSQASANVSNATGTLPIANGGTGQTTRAAAFDSLSPATTEGDLNVRGSANTQRLAIGTTGQILTVDTTVSGKTKWAAPAAPNVSNATGVLPVANGGTGSSTQNFVDLSTAQTIAGQKTFNPTPNFSALTTAGVLTNSATGQVLSQAQIGITQGGTGAATASAGYAALSPLTTKGDLVVNNQRLPVGTDAQVLVADSTTSLGVKWGAAASTNPNVSNATGTLAIANGGTGQTTKTAAFNALSPVTTAGDLITSDGTNNTRLGIGSSGQYLTVSGGQPSWATVAPGALPTFYAASYYLSVNQSLAIGQNIKWDTKWNANSDPNGIYSTSTGLFTVPAGATGWWCLMVGIYPNTGSGTNFNIKINGANSRILVSAGSGAFNNASRTMYLAAGSTVGIYAYSGSAPQMGAPDPTYGPPNEAAFYRVDR